MKPGEKALRGAQRWWGGMISDSASRSHDVDGHYPGKVVVPGAWQRIRREFHVAGGRKQLVSCCAVGHGVPFDCTSCTCNTPPTPPQYMAGILVATGNEGENVRRREWRWRIRETVCVRVVGGAPADFARPVPRPVNSLMCCVRQA